MENILSKETQTLLAKHNLKRLAKLDFLAKEEKKKNLKQTKKETKKKTRKINEETYKLNLKRSRTLKKANKQKALEYCGGKCSICNYNKCPAALHFHHKDPQTKTKQVSQLLTYDWNIIKEELDKCILLCANCHHEIHWF